MEIQTIPYHHPLFPDLLKEIGNDCPSQIYLSGNTELLTRKKTVAIIGSRKSDKQGNEMAYKLGVYYAEKGYVVISGLALGCDSAAHRGCLSVNGETIAIVASGLDLTHPKENKDLQKEILLKGGLLLSEQPVGIKANPTKLIARNRLQAGLSELIIVVQCPLHSGTMHTVYFAKQYKKRIMAVTFPYWNELNSGNKELIEAEIAKPFSTIF